ncbi:ABC transporter permease [Promicromonospora citrea]|uniref:Sugar ABC transporter permease n=1 Tax=Promicromonospora citrea TaxID=43677 RepID=A0A8H9L8R4_9MICO|nr:ABC transporter permease subunit [Promicromonospora citrea]NNH53089.1 sugar ABC transporter permease [Promicromonospora citrea]GGM44241.1 sugar ABC transporter permease [Promicromonospora citrea]
MTLLRERTEPGGAATTGRGAPPGPGARLRRHLGRSWQLWVLLLPAIAFTAVFAYVPMYGIQLAFREFDFQAGLTGGEWVGLKYFEVFFSSPMFGTVLRNTLTISIATLVVGFLAPIALALVINQIVNATRKRFMQTATYLPHFISVVVVVGMLQVLLNPSNGTVTRLFSGAGLDLDLLGDPDLFVPVYVISEVWQHCGWNSIIYLAALASVDTQLYEAARIDGAGRLHLIRHVDIPALVPTMIVLFILTMGGVLSTGFEKVWLMQNALNLPVSEVIATYTYRIGILGNQFSLGTAIGLFNTVINFLFLVVTNWLAKKFADTSLW